MRSYGIGNFLLNALHVAIVLPSILGAYWMSKWLKADSRDNRRLLLQGQVVILVTCALLAALLLVQMLINSWESEFIFGKMFARALGFGLNFYWYKSVKSYHDLNS